MATPSGGSRAKAVKAAIEWRALAGVSAPRPAAFQGDKASARCRALLALLQQEEAHLTKDVGIALAHDLTRPLLGIERNGTLYLDIQALGQIQEIADGAEVDILGRIPW